MAKRIVLKNYRKTCDGISEGIDSPQCARLVQAIEKVAGRLDQKDGSLAKDVLLMSNDADFYYVIEA